MIQNPLDQLLFGAGDFQLVFRQDGLQFRDLFQRNPLLKIPLFQVAAIQQAGQGFFYVWPKGVLM